MHKKLITACMALVAFAAFVLPATASAANDPQLTTSGGALVGTGTTIVGTNIGETNFMATDGKTVQVHCANAKLSGTLKTNTGGNVKGEITTFDFWGDGAVSAHNNLEECTGSFGSAYITVPTSPLFLESTTTMAEHEFQVSSTGGGNIKFIIGSTTAGACEYESTSSVKGDYTTAATTKLTVRNTQAGSGSRLIKGGFLCPTSGQLNMTFYVEDSTGSEYGVS